MRSKLGNLGFLEEAVENLVAQFYMLCGTNVFFYY